MDLLWGSSDTNIFAVGDNGTIIRYDGAAWKKMAAPTSGQLFGVWGSGPHNVYAVGEQSTILQYAPCACNVGALCYQSGDVDGTGCQEITCSPL